MPVNICKMNSLSSRCYSIRAWAFRYFFNRFQDGINKILCCNQIEADRIVGIRRIKGLNVIGMGPVKHLQIPILVLLCA